MKSSITISLVAQARGGPFVFWDSLEEGCRQAAALGFDGVEVFSAGPEALDASLLRRTLNRYHLQLAAMGTGAGWLIHGLTLTDADSAQRRKAIDFVRKIIDLAGACGAPAIIGSMQGRYGSAVDRDTAFCYLVQGLDQLAESAAAHHQPLLYEPLNRYETNICNTLAEGMDLLQRLSTERVRLLVDLFHMNIEEANPVQAIRDAGAMIGHVHFVDSNRRPIGAGHLAIGPLIEAMRSIGYDGFLSAEALPWPDPQSAAQHTIEAFRRYVVDA